MNTAELPKLRASAPRVREARQRWQALEAAEAKGDWFGFSHYDVMVGPEWAWIAQDDWLPEPGGYDPVADEWREVLSLTSRYGLDDLGEPFYDSVTGVWVWVVFRPLHKSPGPPQGPGLRVSVDCLCKFVSYEHGFQVILAAKHLRGVPASVPASAGRPRPAPSRLLVPRRHCGPRHDRALSPRGSQGRSRVSGHVCSFKETARITNALPGRGVRTTVYLACSCGATDTRNE